MQTWRSFLDKLKKEANSVLSIGAGVEDKGKEPFDLMLIAGEPPATRRYWIVNAPDIVSPGGWVMLGNANRPEYWKERAKLKEKAKTVKTFDDNSSGSKFRVMEFYQMPGATRKKGKKKDESRTQPEQE